MKCPFCIKVCTKCKRILVAYKGNFTKNTTCKYGITSTCKVCRKKYDKQYNKDNSEHIKQYNKQWRKDNPEYMKQYNKQWNKDNSEHVKQYNKQYYEDNSEYFKQYYEDNSEYIKQYYKQRWDKYLEENGLERGEGSIGEQKVRELLTQSNITFSEQHRFDDCKFKLPLPFDFYIPSLNIAIEYDGRQHFNIVKQFGGLDGFIETIIRDTIKNDYCRRNNIRLIRIPYWEFDNIESILSDLL